MSQKFPIVTVHGGGGLDLSLIKCATFAATKDHVAAARRLAQEALIDHPAGELAVVLISELATNAVRHSGAMHFTLTINQDADGDLYIKVIDEGLNGLPQLYDEDPDDEGGRGIRLVETLTKRWGITRERGAGMAVWFHIDEQASEAWLNLLLPDND
ncbi:ATP-binding protein [Thermopolyspora sp. NPDC052614]|uniref:ATP-binding protein n=1 Tax=Thermopolyspora sp. NPDC052614 TaxID=3155682 RepID=UPI00343EB318